jgi:hypothetical protein
MSFLSYSSTPSPTGLDSSCFTLQVAATTEIQKKVVENTHIHGSSPRVYVFTKREEKEKKSQWSLDRQQQTLKFVRSNWLPTVLSS